MAAPVFRLANPKTLKYAPHNPGRRVDEKSIASLAESMSKNGLIYPVLVTKDHVIIDGHRRAAAARMLGWESIQTIVTDANPDAVYATVNATGKRMSGNDALGVWIKNPAAISDLQAIRFKAMADCVGINMVKELYQAGFSLQFYNLARSVANYCDDDSNESVTAILRWLLKYPMSSLVKNALSLGESPKIIKEAIEKMRPIKLRAQVA